MYAPIDALPPCFTLWFVGVSILLFCSVHVFYQVFLWKCIIFIYSFCSPFYGISSFISVIRWSFFSIAFNCIHSSCRQCYLWHLWSLMCRYHFVCQLYNQSIQVVMPRLGVDPDYRFGDDLSLSGGLRSRSRSPHSYVGLVAFFWYLSISFLVT